MARSLLNFPRNDIEREAVEILRVRNKPNGGGYTEEEIQWAVSIIQRSDPEHPFLRYSERSTLKPIIMQ